MLLGTDHGLPDIPLRLFKAGKLNRVPTILGANKDEGTMFVPALPLIIKGTTFPVNDQSFDKALEHFFKDQDIIKLIKEA